MRIKIEGFLFDKGTSVYYDITDDSLDFEVETGGCYDCRGTYFYFSIDWSDLEAAIADYKKRKADAI